MDKRDFFDRFCILLNNIKEVHELNDIHDALILWYAENCLLMDPDDVKDRIISDNCAEGVDVLLVDDKTYSQLFIQAKTVEVFENTQKNYSENDIKNTLAGVEFLIAGDYKGKITPTLEDLVTEYHDKDRTDIYKTKVIFLTLKQPPKDYKYIQHFRDKFGNIEVQFISFDEIFDLYVNTYLSQREPPPEKITFRALKGGLVKDVPLKSIVFSCKGEDLAEIYEAYKERIFQQNVRYPLGSRSKSINKQILETAKDEHRGMNFWYYNNGITIVCDKITTSTNGQIIHLSHAQIINGAQTTYALHEAYQNGVLRDEVQLLIKAIESNDRKFIEDVTLYTNSQNAIKLRDLCSNDPIQLELQKILGAYGYFYEIKRGQFEAECPTIEMKKKKYGNNFKQKIISNEAAGQAYLAMYLDQPVIAKRNKDRIFQKDVSGFYDAIFRKDDCLAEKFLLAWELYSYITEKKRHYKKKYEKLSKRATKKRNRAYRYDFIIHSDYLILNLFKDFITHRGYNITSNRKDIAEVQKMIIKRSKELSSDYENIINNMADFIGEYRKAVLNYYHNKFLNNEDSIKLIRKHMHEKYSFVKTFNADA